MLIIADDLTGASDTAVQYRKSGYSAMVRISYPSCESGGASMPATEAAGAGPEQEKYDVVSVNTDTRPLSGEEAYERVYRITEDLYRPGDEIYKKMDSVLRGNPGPELEAVMDAVGFEAALVAPSFPENGRKIIDGRLRVGEKEFCVPELFASTMGRKVEAIRLEEVRRGPESLRDAVRKGRSAGSEVFVLDSASDEDLRIVAEAGALLEGRCVMCGSAGLAKQLKLLRGAIPEETAVPSEAILTVVGSRCAETALQVKKAVDHGFSLVILDTEQVLREDPEAAERECARQVLENWREGRSAVVVAVDSLFQDKGFVLKEDERDYSNAQRIVRSLGRVVETVFSGKKPDVIISVGGDTSLQICEALGAVGIEILDEIMPGVPVGMLIGGRGTAIRIVTKSGGFGGEDALLQILEYIGKGAKR